MKQNTAKKECYEIKVNIPGYSYFQIEKAIIEWLKERQRQDKKVLISFTPKKNRNQNRNHVIKTMSLSHIKTITIEESTGTKEEHRKKIIIKAKQQQAIKKILEKTGGG